MNAPAESAAASNPAPHRWDDAFERATHIEMRRSFVQLKGLFMQAAADVSGPIGMRLLHEVRRSTQIEELWRIRAPILCSLPADDERADEHRRNLQRNIDSLFTLLPSTSQ